MLAASAKTSTSSVSRPAILIAGSNLPQDGPEGPLTFADMSATLRRGLP